MGSRTPKTRTEWSDELGYITRANHCNLLANFNNDRACFAEYCKMQANFALADGFPEISKQIAKQGV